MDEDEQKVKKKCDEFPVLRGLVRLIKIMVEGKKIFRIGTSSTSLGQQLEELGGADAREKWVRE